MPYHRDSRIGGNSGKKYARRGAGGFSQGDSPRPIMHKAICSECNKECEVPFKPSGDKAVFCRNCFKNKGPMNPRELSGRDFGKSRIHQTMSTNMTNDQFKILNSKLDRILDALGSDA